MRGILCTGCTSHHSGNEFAVCPFGRQQRNVAVEQASDSSRNFVIRLEDRATKRHAFVGLSFTERGEAFDFNVALVRVVYRGGYLGCTPHTHHRHTTSSRVEQLSHILKDYVVDVT